MKYHVFTNIYVLNIKDLDKRHSKVKGVIVDILKEISKAADKLEKKLDDHVFDMALFESSKVYLYLLYILCVKFSLNCLNF